jgi:hypothetical protein
MYVNQKFLNSLDWVLLEIKLPREIDKSPYATEVALAALLQSGGIGHKYAVHFEGKLPTYFSLEIASLEGVVHFYIRTQKKFRPLVESNFYAQYPGIEIVEADDYTKLIRYHHLSKDTSLWGMNYRLSKTWNPVDLTTGKPYPDKKDPKKKYSMKADFFPIKTYVDYGLDKDPKEEYKVDPLAQVIEMLGGMGKGQYMWYQILVQDESVYDKKFPKFYVNEHTHEHVNLSDMAEKYKKQLRTAEYIKHGDPIYDKAGNVEKKQVKTGKVDADGKPIYEEVDVTYNLIKDPAKDKVGELEVKSVPKKQMDLTDEEKAELEAINNKFAKPLALVSMRLVFVTKKENSNTAYIQSTLSMPKPFAGWNSFAPARIVDPYDYPWQKIGGKRPAWRGEELFEAYVERAGFFPHIKKREALDSWEDVFFWSSTMRARKTFRMFYEILLHPFEHPSAEDIVFTVNLEELATLWHLPGSTVATPTLPRIDSTKGVAPVNLPL